MFNKKQRKTQNTEESKMKSLGPIDYSEKVKDYEPFLNYAFEDPKVLNIAITAPKGAGKSSILQTYLKNHSISAMNISVGLFKTYDDNATDKIIDSNQVENKILNQIIHQISPHKIPASRFHIDRGHIGYRVLMGILIGLLAVVAVYLFQFPTSKDIFTGDNEICQAVAGFMQSIVVFIVSVILFASILAVFGIIFFRNYSHKRIPKVAVKDCAIDPICNEHDTMFNRYLDEILYMLIHSGYNAIIFEDLERLEDKTIWEKLREINHILNKRLIIKVKGDSNKYMPIKFVYVTTDSLFEGKDRVKFFDCIIPIVPIVDKSNSRDVITTMAEEYGYNIDKVFLGSINEYVDDMRMIKNVFNEMLVYDTQLAKEGVELNHTRLFAILLYKNMLPQDYERFQYNEGAVYSFLRELDIIRDEALESKNLSSDMYEKILFGAPKIYFPILGKNFDEIYADLMYGTLTSNDDQSYLVKYLIEYGYISAESKEYISYFYPKNITENENKFILDVKHNTGGSMDKKLENIDYIISEIKRYFDSECVLNYDLVYYVLTSLEIYQEQILRTIMVYESYKFIDGFIDYLENKKHDRETLHKFVVELNEKWNNIFKDMKNANNDRLYKRYVELSVSYCTKDKLLQMNINNCLTDFLNNTNGFIGG